MDWQRVLEFFSPIHRHARQLDEERRMRDLAILRAGGWECHACGEIRPDEMIGVGQAVIDYGGVKSYATRRYCVDRPNCVDDVAAQLDRLRREGDNRKEQA